MIKEKKNRQLTDPKTRWGPYFNHILSNLFPYKFNIYLNSETEISQAARERNAGIRVQSQEYVTDSSICISHV